MDRNTGLDGTEENWNEQPEVEQEGQPKVEDERESIWTIPAKLKRWYFALFSIQVVVAVAWLVRTAIVDENRNGVPDILTYLWLNMAPAAVSSATFALVVVDTAKGIMVLSTWLEDELKKRRQRQIKSAVEKAVAEAVAESRTAVAEARTKERQRWVDWNRRREAAAAAGEDFNEPPPGIDQELEEPYQK